MNVSVTLTIQVHQLTHRKHNMTPDHTHDIRGEYRPDGSFIGYNYRTQQWIETRPGEMVGTLVKFKIPGLNGPRQVTGTVKRLLPALSKVEVKTQHGDYYIINVNTILGQGTP